MHIKISHIKYTDKTKSIMMCICKTHSLIFNCKYETSKTANTLGCYFIQKIYIKKKNFNNNNIEIKMNMTC